MGIKLDWEVESDAGWSEVGEDPAALDARRRRMRQLRNLGFALAAVAVIAAGIVGWRLRQAAVQLRANLEATVTAETTALRIGDETGFLHAQADVGEWQRIQGITFDQYRALGERIDVTGEIVEMDITANQARVVLKEVLDGEPYHVQWFYEHTEGNWRHIPPSPDFWGEQTTSQTIHFEFFYYEEDAGLAEALKVRMNGWWEIACQMTLCSRAFSSSQQALPSMPRLSVRIEPDPLSTLGWAAYDDTTLLIPSPLLGRVAADGSVNPALLDAINGLLAERLARQTMDRYVEDRPAHSSDLAWVERELALWLRHAMNDTAPPSGFFEPLAASYGATLVPDLLEQAATIEANGSIVPTLESLTGAGAATLPLAWDSYLAHLLSAEAALIADGQDTEATVLYRDPEREPAAQVLDVPVESLATPGTIDVISTRLVGGVLWAETRFSVESPEGEGDGLRVAFEPYRLVDGRWVHTYPQIEDWGALHEDHSANIVLEYYALDAPAVEGLLPAMEQIYGTVIADTGLDPAQIGPLRVSIIPSAGNGANFGLQIVRRPRVAPADRLSSEIPAVVVPSPNAAIRANGVSVQEYVRETAARGMVSRLLTARLGDFPDNHPFALAFLTWEVGRLGLDEQSVLDIAVGERGQIGPLWPEDGTGWLAFQTPYQDADYRAARILVDVLVEQYGPQAVPVLLRNLPTSANVDDWLSRSLGIAPVELQPAFEEALRAAGGQP